MYNIYSKKTIGPMSRFSINYFVLKMILKSFLFMALGTLIIAYFFESGVPMKDVQERLGHSDIQTTMNIYTHLTENSRENSAKLFANYVGF